MVKNSSSSSQCSCPIDVKPHSKAGTKKSRSKDPHKAGGRAKSNWKADSREYCTTKDCYNLQSGCSCDDVPPTTNARQSECYCEEPRPAADYCAPRTCTNQGPTAEAVCTCEDQPPICPQVVDCQCMPEPVVPQVEKPRLPCACINEPVPVCEKEPAPDEYMHPQWQVAERALPIRPPPTKHLGDGPMQSTTTQKADYCKKPLIRMTPYHPDDNLQTSNARMTGETTAGVDYRGPDMKKFDPSQSFKPDVKYKRPTIRFKGDTTQKMDFIEWPTLPQDTPPWALKRRYEPPDKAMDGNTIYKTSYRGPCMCDKAEPFRQKDSGDIIGGGRGFDSNTIYRDSYVPADLSQVRQQPFRRKDNIQRSDANFAEDTTHQVDYRPWQAEKTNPIYPPVTKHLGDGPMANTTTQKADYGPKPIQRNPQYIPDDNLQTSNARFAGETTAGVDYRGPDMKKFDPSQSFKPDVRYKSPTIRFKGDTTQKTDFIEWPTLPQDTPPWALKRQYEPPDRAMEGNTIYKSSYRGPCMCDKAEPIRHEGAGDIISRGKDFQKNTIYRDSFQPPLNAEKAQLQRLRDNYVPDGGRFSGETTNKMDYRGYYPLKPCECPPANQKKPPLKCIPKSQLKPCRCPLLQPCRCASKEKAKAVSCPAGRKASTADVCPPCPPSRQRSSVYPPCSSSRQRERRDICPPCPSRVQC